MPQIEHRHHRVVGLSGVFCVGLLLFGTRWGSYVGYNPIFFTDALLFAALCYWWWVEQSSNNRILYGRSSVPGWAIILFLSYVVVRSFFGSSLFSITWARDAIPFYYAFVALLAAASYAKSGPHGEAQTMRFLWWCLNGHLLWIIVFVLLIPRLVLVMPMLPGSDVRLFSSRPDIDLAVLGITAALYLRRVVVKRRRFLSTCGLLLSLVACTGFESRAGFFAIMAAMVFSFVLTVSSLFVRSRRQNWLVLAPVLLTIGMIGFSQTDAGGRAMATVGLVEVTSEEQRGALGTAKAREDAWRELVSWTSADEIRLVFGSGFGPNILTISGADHELGTPREVRSPHNWFVGIYARLGIVGVVLIAAVLLSLLHRIYGIRRVIGRSELLTLSSVGAISLLIVGALGVVLESPFGAVPFWWFVGILLAEHGRNPHGHLESHLADKFVMSTSRNFLPARCKESNIT